MRKIKYEPSVHFTDHGDERITLLGKILRASKLDELPQFLNILSGELSFVGPRPQLPEIFQKYDANTQDSLKTITPGVTGIGSLLFRDEAQMLKRINPKNREKFYDQTIVSSKGSLELWYIDNKSFYIDFKILCFTVFVLFYTRAVKLHNYFTGIPDLEIYAPPKEY
jgi:lipopolysaccharide/colanic/teichoic acid biosynthesis glycosyltransferase